MKRIISILLLLIFIYNIIGYYTAFKIVRYQIRGEVKRMIKNSVPEEDLVAIHVRNSDKCSLYWTKPGKEFRYKGEMYDVVRQEAEGSSVTYYCIHDFKESKLFADLNKHIRKHVADNPQQRKKTENLTKKMSQNLFFEKKSDRDVIKKALSVKYYMSGDIYCSVIIDPPTPPPKKARCELISQFS